jgi:ribosomal protein S15P/S13E
VFLVSKKLTTFTPRN